MATSIAQLHGAAIQVEITRGTPPLINPRDSTDVARRAAASAVGGENVRAMETANMGGEDFSYYLEDIPGCYVRFGTSRDGVEQFPAHSSRFDFDEAAIAVGAAYYCEVAKLAGARLAAEGLPD